MAVHQYVAISWVKALDGLLFETAFDFKRFKPRQSEAVMRLVDLEIILEFYILFLY